MSAGSGNANYMLLAEPNQMVLFDKESYEQAMQVPASSQYSAVGLALGLALILISWLPIALLIWFLT
jgi:hypothetical protein